MAFTSFSSSQQISTNDVMITNNGADGEKGKSSPKSSSVASSDGGSVYSASQDVEVKASLSPSRNQTSKRSNTFVGLGRNHPQHQQRQRNSFQNRGSNSSRHNHGGWRDGQRDTWTYPIQPPPYSSPHTPIFTQLPPYGYGGPMNPPPFQNFVPPLPLVRYIPPPPEAFGMMTRPGPFTPPPPLPPPQDISLYGPPTFITPSPPFPTQAMPFSTLIYELQAKIVNQVDYYFSDDNLIKDVYLRQHMDVGGWVPITLIAGFRRMVQLTNDIQLILFALQNSSVVEVRGNKIRKRNNWARWILPH